MIWRRLKRSTPAQEQTFQKNMAAQHLSFREKLTLVFSAYLVLLLPAVLVLLLFALLILWIF